MGQFKYKAKQGPQNIVEGMIEADSQDAAVTKLTQQGLFPISVTTEEAAEQSTSPLFRPILSLTPRVSIKLKDRETFTRQLADLLYGGLPLYQGLELLVKETENKSMKKVIAHLCEQVREGVPLSTACRHFPKVFPPLYTNMIHAGEISGTLDSVLIRLADFAEKEEETRSKIKTALAYPVFLAAVGGVTILVLLLFVIPKLTPVFQEFGQSLPLPTLVIVTISNLILKYWWLLIGGILGAGFFIKKNGGLLGNNLFIDKLILQTPILGPLIEKREISRITRTLGTLLENGIPILKALEIVQANVKNSLYKEEMNKMKQAVTEGHKLGSVLKQSSLFPLTLSHMLLVGEETGNLELSLNKIADTYDREVDRASKMFTTLLEPVLILALGLVIAVIVISMLLPIFNLQMGVN